MAIRAVLTSNAKRRITQTNSNIDVMVAKMRKNKKRKIDAHRLQHSEAEKEPAKLLITGAVVVKSLKQRTMRSNYNKTAAFH